MKLNKDLLMKVGIVAAVLIIIWLVYRSHRCKDMYTDYVPDDEYSENMYAPDNADYAEEQWDESGAGEDYAEQDYGEDDYAEEEYEEPMAENYTLMESTLDDDEANAMFEPEM